MEHIQGKVTPFRQAYLKWCSLRTVPFRKKFFIGYDLDGNTYWEFHNYNNPYRPRRIVEYRETNLNWVDYKMPPQWMQWLRYTRPHYPTLEELYNDKVRQEVLKLKVKAADERWKSIPLKDTKPESVADILQQKLEGQKHKQVNEQQASILKASRPQEMFKPPKSVEDLTAEEQNAIKSQQHEPQEKQTSTETSEPKKDKYPEPPKPIVQANPSDAFEPSTWNQKPMKRG